MAQSIDTIYCEIHEQEAAILFCIYHKSNACLECMTDGVHKDETCKLTKTLPTVVKKVVEEDTPYELFKRECETQINIIVHRKEQRDQFCIQYNALKEKLLQNVKDEHIKVSNCINTMYDDLKIEIDSKVSTRKLELELEKELFEKLESKINQLLDKASLEKLDRPISENNEKLKQIINSINESHELRTRKTEPQCSYKASKEVENILSENGLVGSLSFMDDVNYGSADVPVEESTTQAREPSQDSKFRIIVADHTVDPFDSETHKSLICKWNSEHGKVSKQNRKHADNNEPDVEHVYDDVTTRKVIPISDVTIMAGLAHTKGHPTACTFTTIRPLDEHRMVILDERHSTVIMMQYEGIVIDQISCKTRELEMCTMSGLLVAVLSVQDKGFTIEMYEANDKLIPKNVICIEASFNTRVIGFDYFKKIDKFAVSTKDNLHFLLGPNKKLKTLSVEKRASKTANDEGEIKRVHDFEREKLNVFTINRKTKTIICAKFDKHKPIWNRTFESEANVGMCLSNQRIYIPFQDEVKKIHAVTGTDSKTFNITGDNLAVGVDETNKILIVTKLSSNPEESRKIQLIPMIEEKCFSTTKSESGV